MQRYEYIQRRGDPEPRQRLAWLRSKRRINVSAWLRSAFSNALAREFPAPLPGWIPDRLPDGSWESLLEGDAGALPDDLAGALIAVTPTGGNSFTTVREVIQRSELRILVRDSGRNSKENPK